MLIRIIHLNGKKCPVFVQVAVVPRWWHHWLICLHTVYIDNFFSMAIHTVNNYLRPAGGTIAASFFHPVETSHILKVWDLTSKAL